MADNVTIPTTGSGTATPVIATDDVSSVHYQKIKIALGADGAIDTLLDSGQQTMANSAPVVLASDQTAIPASQSGTWNVTNVSGTVSLPTGASTLAEQQSQTTHLATIAGDTTAIQTAVELLDDTVATDGAATPTKGILIAGQDGTNAQTIKTDSDGNLQVDILNATVAVTQSGTWDEVGVNDSGNSLTVDAPVGTPVFVRLSDGSAAITTLPVSLASVPSHAVTNAGTFAVQVDGAALTSLQLLDDTVLVEDAAAPANPSGIPLILVREDARAGGLTTADGDNVAARGNNLGELYTKDTDAGVALSSIDGSATQLVTLQTTGNGWLETISNSAGSIADDAAIISANTGVLAAAIMTDDVAFTPATTSVMMAGFEYDDTTPDSVNEGDGGAARMSANRNIYTQIRDAAGNERGVNVTAGNALTVDGSGVTQPVSGTITANLAAGTNNIGDVDVLSIAAGDNNIGNVDIVTVPAPLSTTGGGTEATALRVTVASDSTGVLSVDDNGASLTVDGTVTASNTAGDIANGSADSGNPVKGGSVAYNFDGTVPGTAVDEGDRVNQIADVYGRQYVETTHPNYWTLSADYASAQTNTSLKAAPAGSLKLYITDVIISNGATAGNVTLLNGSGGTVLLELYPGINGGLAHSFRTPIALTANTALCITSTTVTTHSVTICGYTAP